MLFVYLFSDFVLLEDEQKIGLGVLIGTIYTPFEVPIFLSFDLVFEHFCEYNVFCEPCVGSFCFGKSLYGNGVFPGQNSTRQDGRIFIEDFQISSKCITSGKNAYHVMYHESEQNVFVRQVVEVYNETYHEMH